MTTQESAQIGPRRRAEKPSPDAIRRARADNPKLRERELASQLGISEAEFITAWCGLSATRLEPRVNDVLNGLEALGEVMALTRNESAVHEKIGIYDRVHTSARGAIVLGDDIDLRIFRGAWVHAFAVEKDNGERISRSLQFFDARGEAVHKVHLRTASDVAAYHALVESLTSSDQSQSLERCATTATSETGTVLGPQEIATLREKWAAMTDVHQFAGILRSFDITRHDAISAIDPEFAWRLDGGALKAMLHLAANGEMPIMCFVGSPGCVQIHTGPVRNIKPLGPWLNVLDPGFHLHLRLDHIEEVWAVRKPNRYGHITSLEAYDRKKRLIIQFFGKRPRDEDERDDWRFLMENLPRLNPDVAA